MRNLLKKGFLGKLWDKDKDAWTWAICLGTPLLVLALITTYVLVRDAYLDPTAATPPTPPVESVTVPVSTNETLETASQETNVWATRIVWGLVVSLSLLILWFKAFRKTKRPATTKSEDVKETASPVKTRRVFTGLIESLKKVTIPAFVGRFFLRSAVVFMVLFAGYMLMTTVFPDAWYNHVVPQVMQFQSARPTEFWISLTVVSFLLLVIIWPKKQVELDKDQKKKRDELRDNIIYWPFEMVKYVVIVGLLVGIPTLFIADALRGNKSIGERQRELAATNTPRVGTQQARGKQVVIQRIEGEAVKGRWTTVYDLGRRSMTWQDAPILVLPNGELSQVFLATPGTPAGPGVGKLLSAAFMVPQDSPHEKVKFVIEYYE